jgi:16S rRNA (cytosine967-C5)-methyltransferase
MKEKGPRRIALHILEQLDREESNSALLLQDALGQVEDPRDRNLITDLVLGVLRWRSKLLFYIDVFSRRPRSNLDPKVVLILQLGIYQLLFTEIPQHAAVYETVSLCRRMRLTSAASFVNGILRAVQGKLSDLPEPENAATCWSHPEWLARRWEARFGKEECLELLRANNEPATVFLRVNELHADSQMVIQELSRENVNAAPARFGPAVLAVQSGSPQSTDSFRNGHFYIHDAAIEILGNMMQPEPGSRVLEIAAAPGGKTFQLAARMRDQGLIVSVDSDRRRMRTWKRNCERLKIRCAQPLIADARRLGFADQFDLVVVDAPCSSLGVVRRHPEIKWRRTEKDVTRLAALQLQVLSACSKYVRDRGRLVYSVCSFEPEETSQVIEQFLSQQPSFQIIEQRYLYPHRHQTDGFYMACLVAPP